MQTLPIVNFNDLVDTIYTTARLADLKALSGGYFIRLGKAA
jgi:hypothetical protein